MAWARASELGSESERGPESDRDSESVRGSESELGSERDPAAAEPEQSLRPAREQAEWVPRESHKPRAIPAGIRPCKPEVSLFTFLTVQPPVTGHHRLCRWLATAPLPGWR